MLYLIPFPLDPEGDAAWISPDLTHLVRSLKVFFCEDEKTTRRVLKRCFQYEDLSALTLIPIGKHADIPAAVSLLRTNKDNNPVALVSESGMPAIADPGARIVAEAHRIGMPVKSIPGPNSILMTLAASGLNGQSFAFHGYLPIEEQNRKKVLLELEQRARLNSQTQLFIEVPHRCGQLLKTLLLCLHSNTRLCLGINLGLPDERIETRTIGQWRDNKTDIHKKLVVFALG